MTFQQKRSPVLSEEVGLEIPDILVFSYGFQPIKDAFSLGSIAPFLDKHKVQILKPIVTITVTVGSIETGKQKQKKERETVGKRSRETIFDSLEYILAFRVYPQPAY